VKNPFYAGQFRWEGKLYQGTHTALVSRDQFDRVQAVFRGHNKPRYGTHDFPYRGLLTRAYDNCKVTAEIKKGKYTHYRCTQYRGKCRLPYMREEELGGRLGRILRDIHIPDDILTQLQQSLLSDRGCEEAIRSHQERQLQQRLATACAGDSIRRTKTNWTLRSARSSGRENLRSGRQRSSKFKARYRG